jgi:hypothetical protein
MWQMLLTKWWTLRQSVKEALSGPQRHDWLEAIDKELESIQENDTAWDLYWTYAICPLVNGLYPPKSFSRSSGMSMVKLNALKRVWWYWAAGKENALISMRPGAWYWAAGNLQAKRRL